MGSRAGSYDCFIPNNPPYTTGKLRPERDLLRFCYARGESFCRLENFLLPFRSVSNVLQMCVMFRKAI